MTNKEKFKEVFGYETIGFICPTECPVEFRSTNCKQCPYHDFGSKEYKKQEPEVIDYAVLSLKVAKIAVDLEKVLTKHSPVPVEEVIGYVCIFMDTLTGDDLDHNFDLLTKRTDLAEKILKEWPHSVEYYKRQRKEDKE